MSESIPSAEHQAHVRWHQSVIVRVVLLCGVLLLCLLGSVYVLSRYFFLELMNEWERQARDIVNSLEVHARDHPELDIETLRKSVGDDATDVQFEPWAPGAETKRISMFIDEDGQFTKSATLLFTIEGQTYLATATVTGEVQDEILRALKNKYLWALTSIFVVALGLMIYVIARTLHPLRELSVTCARISEGNLDSVRVRHTMGEVRTLERTFNRMVAALKEKELVEANLRQAQRLSAIGNLAAGVAHDVRNPLNAIKLLSGHALDKLKDDASTTDTRRQIETIRHEVDRLEEIVSGFLSLAKEKELQPVPTEIDLLLDECIHLVEKDAEARDIRLMVELRASETELMMDPKQITRAMLNVIINALEACQPGGRVRIFSRKTDWTCEVEIRDDGPGMAREVFERAFDPYYTTKKTGTGLGLSITRGIIEEHSGTIEIHSTQGQGTQVVIALPLGRD